MKKSQVKSMFILLLIFVFIISLIYAVSTTLLSPVDNFSDNDGNLDLRASCAPTAYDGFTSWNITTGSLYSIRSGTWQIEKTIQAEGSLPNNTYLFNFTNVLNGTDQSNGFFWNVQCNEQNVSDFSVTNSAFAGNRTIRVDYADPTVVTTSPIDNSYSLNGHAIPVVCTASPSSNWNITTVSLYTDIGGTWILNQTHVVANPHRGEVVANFTINQLGNASIADGTNLLFACQAIQVNEIGDGGITVSTLNEKTSKNRTLNVEYPPQVTLDKPADNNWSQNLRVNLNWTVVSAFGSNVAPFKTRIWTNQSGGVWSPATGIRTANNNSGITQDYTFPQQTAIIWGVQAIDGNDPSVFNFSVNRTINLDSIDPVISVATTNNSFSAPQTATSNLSVITLQFTPTDTNLNTVLIHTNITGINEITYTNRTATTGVQIRFNISADDGIYTFNFFANDSSTRSTNTTELYIVVDTIPPAVTNINNVSVVTACRSRNVTFTTNELATATMQFDIDTDVSDGTTISADTTERTSHGIALDFGFNTEVTHSFNLTVTDRAGNVNTTVGQTTMVTPASVCNGWSQYAVYDSKITLSTIQNQTGADLIYIWNATDQDWILHTAGISTNGDYVTGLGVGMPIPVVHLFENTNSTWFRNITNNGIYEYNVSQINNFIAAPFHYNFGNLTESFMNSSRDFPSQIESTGFGFNLTFFAGYNNSIQDYVSHNFNFTFNNLTIVEACPTRINKDTCMEAFWVASDFNVTWNTSSINFDWTR